MEQPMDVKLASTGKRIAAAAIDLLLIPIVIGVVLGIILVATKADQSVQMVLMVGFNVAWMIVRDMGFAPGRMMVGIRLVKTDGGPVGFGTAIGRNIHLVIPLVLIIGYLVEFISLLATGHRVADVWAGTKVVET
jgi:uncharacterized RDD family membrane protein YckC